jgi:hypothetical protein
MHTIHDPRKIVVNPHNRVGITEIHHPLHNKFKKCYIATWPNLNATQGKFTNIAADTRVASVAQSMPLPYRRLTRRWVLVRIGIVELLTFVIIVFIII